MELARGSFPGAVAGRHERIDVIERTESGGYRLTAAGRDLEQVVWGIGDWAMQWLFGDPEEQANPEDTDEGQAPTG